MLGSSNEKYSWQALTVSMLFVLNNFMKNRLITKSSDASWDLLSSRRWALFPRGSFGRGDFWPGGFLSGRAFVRGAFVRGGSFVRGNFSPGGLCPFPQVQCVYAPSRLSVPSMIYVYPAGGRIQLT